MNLPSAEAGPPDPGSIHYFAELYALPQHRARLRAAHALEAGVRASLRSGLDHQLAHTRLHWWQQEAERIAAGRPAHPLAAQLLAIAGARPLGAALQELVQLTQADLAGGQAGDALRRALAARAGGARFALLAVLLQAEADAAHALGSAVALLPRAEPGAHPAARKALSIEISALRPALQPPLRALLVWSVLALRRARRSDTAPPERAAASRRALLGDNWLAWRAARAADAGRIQRIFEVTRP